MARNRKRTPLYEVISSAQAKPGSAKDKTPEKDAQPEKSEYVWPKKPRALQITGGKVEISVPYQVVVAVVLGAAVLLLLAFRLGAQWQASSSASGFETEPRYGPIIAAERTEAVSEPIAEDPAGRSSTLLAGPSESKGDHWIVIQQYRTRADLVPVQQYFAGNGIATQIQQQGDVYFLMTADLYENPEKPGTDGYKLRQEIVRLGKDYKAPQGRESFAPNFFADAYGRKAR